MTLAIGIRYLTGYAIATDVSARDKAEWPLHPARVFMAMAAAYFETGTDSQERRALSWLERQESPAMYVPDAVPRTIVTHYVPVNDKAGPAAAEIQSCPGLSRSKQPRSFPRVRLDEDTLYLLWPEATPDAECLAALDRLCSKVIRIGHSSSLVQMWRADGQQVPNANLITDSNGEEHMRIATAGTLEYLESSYNLDAIERHAALGDTIAQVTVEKKSVKGDRAKERKAELDGRIAELTNDRDRIDAHSPVRPRIGRWQPYRRVTQRAEYDEPISGAFARELMVMSKGDGPVLGLETTWRLLTALRNTILSTCGPVVPEWISGHQPDGSPSEHSHMSLVPLAFVGDARADGHLMGVGLAFPRAITHRERGSALSRLLFDKQGQPRSIKLLLGSLGEWTLGRETRDFTVTPTTLRTETWTAPSDTWATVTPIVLDRHPKSSRAKDREQWSRDVTTLIVESCERQGLPAPVQVDIDTTCWHRGSPRAVPGNGGGYPLIPVKTGQHSRQQVHAWLRFNRKIVGPLILGAGRYRGYGFCKPWTASRT